MKTQRPFKAQDGNTLMIFVDWCECRGKAEWKDGAWTEGRRGPPGGVCGACGGAIEEEGHVLERRM